MKAILYAIKQGEIWSWQFSLELSVDLAYWYRKGGETHPLVWLEPELSLGQAIALLKVLDGETKPLRAPDRVVSLLEGKWQVLFQGVSERSWRKIGMDWQLYREGGYKLPLDSFGPRSERIAERLAGRALLPEEMDAFLETGDGAGIDKGQRKSLLQLAFLNGRITLSQGVELRMIRHFWKTVRAYRCRRCGSSSERMRFADCLECGGPCPYCEECLGMGRSRFCSLLVEGNGVGCITAYAKNIQQVLEEDGVLVAALEKWNLSPAQTEACFAGLKFLRAPSDTDRNIPYFLVWAVTGAGKTEMIFPFIEQELNRGGKVLIATPRRDVVLELMPRIRRAFPAHSVVALYGGSEQRWEQGEITLATTHQLLRFSRAFDLVVIDEVDAFPFHNSPALEFAARKSVKPGGRCILLSATPPKRLQILAKRGKLPHVRVPVRYHRHPLPIPAYLPIPDMNRIIRSRNVPLKLERAIKASLHRGAQLFVFVSRIVHVDPLVAMLRHCFPDMRVAGTSSRDEERSGKVMAFRQNEINILVTTTILERGVTVPKTDVFILNADSGLFEEAALIQMSGRAGRSKDDPHGRVYFAAKEVTKAQANAIRQLRRMNRLARKKGYLLEQKEGLEV